MKKVTLTSTLGLSTAFLITILAHEAAHFGMSVGLGYETILYHNRVLSKIQDVENHQILISGIGPLFSLFQGIISYKFSKRMKKSPLSLFTLWLGLAGIITFFGYLIIAVLIDVGDTGKVFSLLNVPTTVQVIISIVSLVLVTLFLMKSTEQFERYVDQDFGSVKKTRTKWAFKLLLTPMIVSIGIVTIFQFPVTHIASILATVCAPFSIMAVFGTFLGRKKKITNNESGKRLTRHFSISLVVLFLVVVLLNRLLVNGVKIDL